MVMEFFKEKEGRGSVKASTPKEGKEKYIGENVNKSYYFQL